MDSSGYLAVGALFVIFGVVAILIRKHSIKTSRRSRAFAQKIGFRLPSEHFYEISQTVFGGLFAAVGVGFIIAGLIMLARS